MTSRVRSKNKGKQAKRKNSVKTRDQTQKKRYDKEKRKQRHGRRESNPVDLQTVQAIPWPLHHSDTHCLKN